ncbi:MAG: hypothetical protein DYH12_21835 [Sorangiineae bacterium PRO1]|nr:hypothetical protein [Sorangiineae bacterium PRO1]
MHFSDVPAGYPRDLRALALTVLAEGPAMLAGYDPGATGLLVVHPEHRACPPLAAARGEAVFFVRALDELATLAADLGAPLVRRAGWFCVLLAGRRRTASIRLAPASVIFLEAAS